ncbi:MAG: YhdP family protein [Pseudomonadota bacterium]
MFAKLTKWLLYAVGALIVLLALAVGLLRLAMPQLPEYRDDIIARISEAIDGDVNFERLDARWRLRGPEIVFYNVRIGPAVGEFNLLPIEIETMTVGVSVSQLVLSQQLEIRRVGIEGTALHVERSQDGWVLQGATALPVPDVTSGQITMDVDAARAALPFGDNVDVRIEDLEVTYLNSAEGREPWSANLERGVLAVTANNVRLDAAVQHASDARADVFLQGSFSGWDVDALVDGDWRATAELEQFSAAMAKALLPSSWRLPDAGVADLTAAVQWVQGALNAATVDLDADSLVPPEGGAQSQVAGHAEWSRTADGWLCAISDFVVGVSDRQWPAAAVNIDFKTLDAAHRIEFDLANVTVYDLPYLASFLPNEAATAVLASQLSGTLRTGDGFAQYTGEIDDFSQARLEDYALNLDFIDLAVAPIGTLPGVSGLTGVMRMAGDAGSLTLNAAQAAVELPAVFSKPVALDALTGTLIWRRVDDVFEVISDAVQIDSASLSLRSTLELTLGGQGGPHTDIRATWSMGDVNDMDALLPDKVLSPKLALWLRDAIGAGEVTSGTAILRGALSEFPFDNDDGEFRVTANARDVTLQYARQWPTLTQVSAEVVLDGLSLATTRNGGLSGRVPFSNANVRFKDLRSAELFIDTADTTPLPLLYEFSGDSPIRKLFGSQFDNMQLAGTASYEIALAIPLRNVKDFAIDATLTTDDGAFDLAFLPFGLSNIDGVVRIDRTGVYSDGMTATLLGETASLSIAPITDDPAYSLQLEAQGLLSAAAMTETLRLPLMSRATGKTPFTGVVRLPRGTPPDAEPAPEAQRAPTTVSITSQLQGLGLDLPYPVGKPETDVMPASLDMSIGASFDARAALGEVIDVVALLDRDDQTPLFVERATLHLGDGEALLPVAPGLFVDGQIDMLRLGDWLNLKLPGGGGWVLDNLTATQVSVDDLFVFGQRLRGVDGTLQRAGANWLIDVQSEAVAGTVSVPRDLSGGQPVVLDMRRLALLEADPVDADPVDPTTLPPLRIRAGRFALGERQFGALEADVEKTPDGLVAKRLATANDAFAITGTADWLVDSDEPEGSRTQLTAQIRSTDVTRMMTQLGYAPGINANDLTSDIAVSWAGGPDDDFLGSLDGEVSVTVVDGTLEEVDPGAGRVVGLISIAELPRRLSLDFRDVFKKGFNFDTLKGDFRIVNGDAYTCNLSLEGASADVGIIGRASLDLRNYNQTAIVGVKVGNTLPAVGAVVAGPQVGAVLLLFSQIFKKPLQGMTQFYYQIDGSWDEPSIERTDSERFVATAQLSGCLLDAGN